MWTKRRRRMRRSELPRHELKETSFLVFYRCYYYCYRSYYFLECVASMSLLLLMAPVALCIIDKNENNNVYVINPHKNDYRKRPTPPNTIAHNTNSATAFSWFLPNTGSTAAKRQKNKSLCIQEGLNRYKHEHVCRICPTMSYNPFRDVYQRRNVNTVSLHAKINDAEKSDISNNLDKGFNLLEIATKNTFFAIPQGPIVSIASESWRLVWKRFMTELAPQNKQTGSYVRPKYTFHGNNNKNTNLIMTLSNEPHRFHVYTGNPCPWCHRVVLTLNLLQIPIRYTVLKDDPKHATKGGWIFSKDSPDTIFGGCKDLYELYNKLEPSYTGRCTAPVLVDTKTRTIVSNESLDIVRMLNQMMILRHSSNIKNTKPSIETTRTNHIDNPTNGTNDRQVIQQIDPINLVPEHLQNDIDSTNEWIYELLNNGVYRCGFATQQSSYDRASQDVLNGLQRCENILTNSRYIIPSSVSITESDILLLPTLIRFDCVYNPLFKAGGSYVRIQSHYPNIYRYIRTVYNEFNSIMCRSIDLPDACTSYYKQLFPLNPGGIIPTPLPTPKLLGFVD